MAIIIECPECSDPIGIEICDPFRYRFGEFAAHRLYSHLTCPGRGKHPQPVMKRKKKLFGLVDEVVVTYEETGTWSEHREYVGPKHSFLVWLALMFGPPDGGLRIDQKWCWWSWETLDFIGDGIKTFKKA